MAKQMELGEVKEPTKLQRIMKRAWAIARAAFLKWGGKIREYFALALKQAWAESVFHLIVQNAPPAQGNPGKKRKLPKQKPQIELRI